MKPSRINVLVAVIATALVATGCADDERSAAETWRENVTRFDNLPREAGGPFTDKNVVATGETPGTEDLTWVLTGTTAEWALAVEGVIVLTHESGWYGDLSTRVQFAATDRVGALVVVSSAGQTARQLRRFREFTTTSSSVNIVDGGWFAVDTWAADRPTDGYQLVDDADKVLQLIPNTARAPQD